MAKFNVKGVKELEIQFEIIGKSAEKIAKMSVYEAARITTDAWRSELEKAIKGTNGTGGLVESLGISSIDVMGGVVNARVGFDGYDSRGMPNPLKANALNSGTSRGQAPTHFAQKASKKSRTKAKKAMSETFQNEIKKINGGK